MSFEKIQPSTGAMSLMAYAVNDTAKNWVAFITHPDSKILELLLTSIPSFFVSVHTISHITTKNWYYQFTKNLKNIAVFLKFN